MPRLRGIAFLFFTALLIPFAGQLYCCAEFTSVTKNIYTTICTAFSAKSFIYNAL
jgi:hypothetical protein